MKPTSCRFPLVADHKERERGSTETPRHMKGAQFPLFRENRESLLLSFNACYWERGEEKVGEG